MIQKTWTFSDDTFIDNLIEKISTDADYEAAAERCMLVFESDVNCDKIQGNLSRLHERFSDLKIFGMTMLGPLDETMILPDVTVCSLMLFESSRSIVRLLNCGGDSFNSDEIDFIGELKEQKDLQGIMIMSSCSSEILNGFLERLSGEFNDIPIFGSQAGSERVGMDEKYVFKDEAVSGNSILAAAFCGENLHVDAGSTLGWQPIGKLHEITEVSGDGRVMTIDGRPAMDLYSKYLGLNADASFYKDSSVFPIIEKTGSFFSARIPYRFFDDGSILYPIGIKEGSLVSFSYSKKNYLLKESLDYANRVSEFMPQGIITICCLNRRLFLGNEDADREISYFQMIKRGICWGYGYSELFRVGKDGGILNSTLVTAAFREGDKPVQKPVICRDQVLEENKDVVPLSDCVVTFLEQTTRELRETIAELRMLTVKDQLTGIANRRMFNDRINKLLQDPERSADTTLLMFDIDFFKQVNDTYGHQTGDVVLRELTEVVEQQIRVSDFFCRWGGEEFICIFENTSIEEAVAIAQRIHSQIETHNFTGVGHITVSIGITGIYPDDDFDSLFHRLDAMLYQAKREGRNSVIVDQ